MSTLYVNNIEPVSGSSLTLISASLVSVDNLSVTNITSSFQGNLQGTASFATTASHALNSTPPAGTDGQLQFNSGSGFGADSNLFWDNTNKRLGVGTSSPTNSVEIVHTTGNSTLNIQGNAATFISVQRFSNNSIRGRLELYKSRGTIASPLVIQTSDEIGSVDFYGYDGSANQRVGILYVNAESVVGSTITAQMAIGLGTSGVTNSYKMVVKNDGNITIGNELTSLGARVGIKGSGSTSATTALLVQNSSGNIALEVRDDRSISTSGGDVSLRDGTFYVASNRVVSYRHSIGFFGNPVASAQVEMQSTTQGFLPPRMTTTQKNAISSPAAGLMVYDTTLNQMSYYNGSSWINF